MASRKFKQHKKKWNQITSLIDAQLQQGTTPQHYFESMAAQLNNLTFLDKSRQGINLQALYLDIGLELVLCCEDWCVKAKNYMKQNHPWQNQTYQAEQGLGATVAGMEEDNISLYLYHSVDYGKYLEGANGFRYPRAGLLHIIEPTIQLVGPQLVSALQGVMNK